MINNTDLEIPANFRPGDVSLIFTGNNNNNDYAIIVQDSSNRKILVQDNDQYDFNVVIATIMNAQIDFNAIRNKYQNNQ